MNKRNDSHITGVYASTAAATKPTTAKPEFMSRVAAPVYCVAEVVGVVPTGLAVVAGGAGGRFVAAGAVYFSAAIVFADAIAVWVHLQVVSYQVY